MSFFKDFNGALEKYLEYKYQNYTVAYKLDFARKICIIRKFIKIDGSLFCIIQNLNYEVRLKVLAAAAQRIEQEADG